MQEKLSFGKRNCKRVEFSARENILGGWTSLRYVQKISHSALWLCNRDINISLFYFNHIHPGYIIPLQHLSGSRNMSLLLVFF